MRANVRSSQGWAMGRYLGKEELKQQSSFGFPGQTSGQVRGRSHLSDNNLKSPGTRFPVQHDLWDPLSHFKEHKSQGNDLISCRQMADRYFFSIMQRIGDWNKCDLLAWNRFKRSTMFPTLHKAVIRCDTKTSAQLSWPEMSRQPEALSNHHINFSTSAFLERSTACRISHAGRCRPTVRQQEEKQREVQSWTIDRSRKGLTSKLLSSVPFPPIHQVCYRAPSFSLAPSRSLINALLLPVCTVYISFDQPVRHISMYLNVPLHSRLMPPVSAAIGAKPHPGTAEGALGSHGSSSLMSSGWPCQRWADGQKALPCMSYLGPGAEHNSVHSGAWMKLLIQCWGFPVSVGRWATKGAWTHRLCQLF